MSGRSLSLVIEVFRQGRFVGLEIRSPKFSTLSMSLPRVLREVRVLVHANLQTESTGKGGYSDEKTGTGKTDVKTVSVKPMVVRTRLRQWRVLDHPA
jgi:hypothetical protein